MSKDYDDYQNLKSQSVESEKEDTEFLEFLRKIEYPNPPNSIVEKAIASYERDYKYRILWRSIKLKVIEYKEALFGTRGGLEIALASTLILFILSGVVYYQYTKPQNNPINIIANQETPAIKVSPNSSDTPIATPSPIQTIRQDDTKENNQQAITKNDTKPRKPEEPKDLYKEDNNIAINNLKRDKRTNNSVKTNAITNAKKKSLTLSNLVYVAVVDLKTGDQEPELIDTEIKQELIQAINNSGKWRLSSVKDAEAIFKKQKNDGALVLFDKETKNILWKNIDYINNYKNNKDYIKTTVETLSNYQKQ